MISTSVIGIMSGTSLDGVDLAYCTFEESLHGYSFSIVACETIPYPETWLKRLISLPQSDALTFAVTHTEYGHYLGELAHNFIVKFKLEPDFVASHGHTIFHNPSDGYTTQIGEGAAIASRCGKPVVCDFRTGDVASGGQGAPLVPIGDQLLFAGYDYCLNLGGFANISTPSDGKRIAFDISPANIVLNLLANKAGSAFDADGKMAAGGFIDEALLFKLNNLDFYHKPPPKSLGREWVEKEILPLLSQTDVNLQDQACTFCEHIAIQIATTLTNGNGKRLLITGGGAFNTYLIQRIGANTNTEIIIPDATTVNYKEALVFAFLGLLRMQSKPNCMASVTGASHNVSGGAIYLP